MQKYLRKLNFIRAYYAINGRLYLSLGTPPIPYVPTHTNARSNRHKLIHNTLYKYTILKTKLLELNLNT